MTDAASEKDALTSKQSKVLAFIEDAISSLGRPPSLREVAKHFGWTAVGSAEDHVKALVRKGFLEKDEGAHCGIRLKWHSENLSVPILGSVPAGHPLEAIADSLGSLSISASHAGKIGKGGVFALKVTGESMIEAGIMDGDYVVVKRQSAAENGDIVVAMIDGEATVKRLEISRARMRLLPANPKFRPIELDPARENVIQGRVISVQRYL